MAIKDFFHPIFKRGLEKEPDSVHNAIIETLQQPIDDAKKDLMATKVDSYLDLARGTYLDRFGSWLGLYRKKDWSDDYYRDRIKKHVLHERDTVNAIREALANFLETEVQNIQIYEPYRDMMIWNKSEYNTLAFFPSAYYRYAVIDIKVDATVKPGIEDIINLFRPAGVIWVLTVDINGSSPEAPILDISTPKSFTSMLETDLDYVGFQSRNALEITPGIDSARAPVDNPFIYNDSIFNHGKVYYDSIHPNDNYAFLGQMYKDYTPLDTDRFADSRAYAQQYAKATELSNINGRGKTWDLLPEKNNLIDYDNLLSKPNQYITKNDTSLFFDYNVDVDRLSNSTLELSLEVNYDNVSKLEGSKRILLELSYQDSEGKNHYLDVIKRPKLKGSFHDRISETFTCEKIAEVYHVGVYIQGVEASNLKVGNPRLETDTSSNELVGTTAKYLGVSLQQGVTYQIGIKGNSDKTYANDTLALTYGGQTTNIRAGLSTVNHYYTAKFTPKKDLTEVTLSLKGAGNKDKFTYDFLSIKPQEGTTPMYYSLNWSQPQDYYGITSAVDVQHYINVFDTENFTTEMKNYDDVYEYFDINLNINALSENRFTIWVYNFELNLWVNYDSYNIGRGFQYIKTKIGALSPYLNQNGLLFYKLQFDYVRQVTINYFGLNLGYKTDEVPTAFDGTGGGVREHIEGYSPRIDPTKDGAHLYLDYHSSYKEE